MKQKYTIHKNVKVDITFEDLQELCLNLPQELQAELIAYLFEFDSVPLLTIDKIYKQRIEDAAQFDKMSKNTVFQTFEKCFDDFSYAQVSKDYQEEAEAWKKLLETKNIQKQKDGDERSKN